MLKLQYYGQNDGTTVPDVTLVGDPAVDQPALLANGYVSGRIMALKTSAVTGRGTVVVPCDASGSTSPAYVGMIPYGTLINGGGEYATSIGPSGSRKAPIVRAMWKGTVDSNSYNNELDPNDPTSVATGQSFVVGAYLYCGGGANAGLWCSSPVSSANSGFVSPIGICTQVPTTAAPQLGVASLI